MQVVLIFTKKCLSTSREPIKFPDLTTRNRGVNKKDPGLSLKSSNLSLYTVQMERQVCMWLVIDAVLFE